MALKRIALAALALFAACAPAAQPPRDVVEAYFRTLGRDPVRTLRLVTPAFHEQHGVHVVTSAEAKRIQRESPASHAAAESIAIDRLELGWLIIQVRPRFAERLAEMQRTLLSEETLGDTSRIAVQLVPPAGRPFEQDFSLLQGRDGRWRIDSISQRDVDATNGFEAFIAHPTDAARRRLEASLRQH